LGFGDDQQYPEGQSESTDKSPDTTDNNKVGVKEKRVVAMSKPLPKMLQDLKESERKSPGAVQLVVGKKGNVIATTLRNQVVEKEQKK
jgi:hypothetical protein